MKSKSDISISIPRQTPMVLLAAVLIGAGAFAVFHTDSSASPEPPAHTSAELPAGASDLPMAPPETGNTLPPGHPSIGASSGSQGMGSAMGGGMPAGMGPDSNATPPTWTAPPGWKTLPNPSAMRLATYRIPRAPGDTEDTDLSVVQAGGTTDANIERWLGQFDEAGKDVRTVKTVHGMKVTIVEVKGSFQGGGMMADNTPSSHPNWALLAAIVETPTLPTFFKMVGPAKSVAASRPAFDALLATVNPASQP
ncbi:MAG: hypothetical protein ABI461_20275 [Polyangiaceae bacterium]